MEFKTASEKATFLKSLKVFFTPFTHYSVKYNTKLGEKELCDCLLVFQNTYIVIQIKERNSKLPSGDSSKWFKKRIIDDAIDQVIDTIDAIKNSDKYEFYNENHTIIQINSSFSVTPIIVFDNDNIDKYDRVVFSKRLGHYVNIFSLGDFIDAFDELLIPFEIIEYLRFRTKLCKKENNIFDANNVISDTAKGIAILQGGITCEDDLSQYYYVHTYFDESITKTKVEEFNRIVNSIIEHAPTEESKTDLAYMFCALDVKIACQVVDKWYLTMERCSLKEYFEPYGLWMDDYRKLIYFLTNPANVDEKTFLNQAMKIAEIRGKEKNMKIVYPIIIREFEKRRYSITVGIVWIE